jgi:bifunctional UDP-N-acetylglucosamine pyrophosphorylase/glucosamine-1-phosphate N-acetyltransferase
MLPDKMPILVVLAGGVSRRLWPIIDKSFVQFFDVPLFSMQLSRLVEIGYQDVIVIANSENAEAIRRDISKITNVGKWDVLVQPQPKGMGDALLLLKHVVEETRNRPIYVVQVHDVIDIAAHLDMLKKYSENSDISYLLAKRMQEYFPGGYLLIDPAMRVQGIVEKPGPGNEPSDLVTLVAHLHSDPAMLLEAIEQEYSRIDQPLTDDHYERAMARLMPIHVFRAVPYTGAWSAIKYPWQILDVMDYFLSEISESETRISDSVQVAASAHISPRGVIIEQGVRILDGASIVGPSYIGRRAIVGNNVLVRGSMIGADSVVGFGSEVARSHVGRNVWFHTNYVGDSVIADGVSFGSGAITANLRLDENRINSQVGAQKVNTGRTKLGSIVGADSRVGVNAVLMPGVKVGTACLVGPCVIVTADLDDASKILVKQDVEECGDDSRAKGQISVSASKVSAQECATYAMFRLAKVA